MVDTIGDILNSINRNRVVVNNIAVRYMHTSTQNTRKIKI